MPKPSEKLVSHFSVQLPEDLAQWLDDSDPQTNELFNEPESVSNMIDPKWDSGLGGLLLPDCIPILGDGMGDKLLARFSFDGTLGEIVRWWHEEMAWLPCGSSVTSALAYLNVVEEVESAMAEPIEPVQLLHRQVLQLLQCPLHEIVGGGIANRKAQAAEMPWQEFRGKMFDPSIFSERIRERLAAEFSMPSEEMFRQDWESAATAAKKVIDIRTDLAWPFAVAGWAAERAGRAAEAVKTYSSGLQSFVATADFTKSWNPAGVSNLNFCLQGLVRLAPDDMPSEAAAMIRSFQEKRDLVSYWSELAGRAAADQRWQDAYRFTLHVGWDSAPSDEPEVLLEQMKEFAEASGSVALARLAEHHRLSV